MTPVDLKTGIDFVSLWLPNFAHHDGLKLVKVFESKYDIRVQILKKYIYILLCYRSNQREDDII